MSTKIKEWWREHEQKILIALALVLVAVVGFRAGQTHERENNSADIKVSLNKIEASNPNEQKLITLGEAVERKGIKVDTSSSNVELSNEQNKKCVLVGSKNSDKYHQSSCSWAEKIKPENKVCFSSIEDAQNKGYKPAKCCNK